ncbi:hypothetical protein [Bacillus kwashiorkori]|uniref:hypothetical protein n=1 Tax=Bacillus kwashiorkori TaxID=1522318 RepID=UPI000784F6B4|nr:hypothetical protein [Bacillus kwashiorkori]
MGWGISNRTDFSGYQLEIAFFFSIFCILAIWVFYDSDKYFYYSKIRHIFWILTIFTGPIGLIIYLVSRRFADEP